MKSFVSVSVALPRVIHTESDSQSIHSLHWLSWIADDVSGSSGVYCTTAAVNTNDERLAQTTDKMELKQRSTNSTGKVWAPLAKLDTG